jgi:hypothetical protein
VRILRHLTLCCITEWKTSLIWKPDSVTRPDACLQLIPRSTATGVHRRTPRIVSRDNIICRFSLRSR